MRCYIVLHVIDSLHWVNTKVRKKHLPKWSRCLSRIMLTENFCVAEIQLYSRISDRAGFLIIGLGAGIGTFGLLKYSFSFRRFCQIFSKSASCSSDRTLPVRNCDRKKVRSKKVTMFRLSVDGTLWQRMICRIVDQIDYEPNYQYN